jgi:sulfite reductase (NADPH) hemoprotein beta-component
LSHQALATFREIEPLVRLSDLDEYRRGLARRLSGEWDDEAFTSYRVRFGVYGQKQPGVQMIRIKIPGGVVPTPWLNVLARYNREFCKGDLHITTRQDFQSYFVPMARSGDALEFLYANGLTTREACGNTIRNVTACALAGACPRELVDAGAVADRLARSWLRQPLVQQMPRKMKFSISGCGTDCGASSIHDLGFVATEKNGKPGFRVLAAGGLGGQPRPAVEVLDFVTEEELPVVVEASTRLHHRYSDRINRNAARMKFLAKRFGDEKFTELFREEFNGLKGLTQRPWEPLSWRKPSEAAVAKAPTGVIAQHDGRVSVVGNPPLGNLSSDQLEELSAIAVKFGVKALRTTRDQNLVIPDLDKDAVDEVVRRLLAINIAVPETDAENIDVISCPGTTTCRIGITSSYNFAREVIAEQDQDASLRGVSVRVSGCQNSCGLHHIADFGFHGMAKKVDGQTAPHYQLHLGGSGHAGGEVGISGPIIPARHAVEVLRLLRTAYADGKQSGETVRSWAERLGKPGLAEVLKPIEGKGHDAMFVDWGDQEVFPGAPTLKGECAAPMASDPLLASQADDALIQLDRLLRANRWDEALKSGEAALAYTARRLLHSVGQPTTEEETPAVILQRVRAHGPANAGAALDHAEAQRTGALSSGRADGYRESVAVYLDTVRSIVEKPVAEEAAE